MENYIPESIRSIIGDRPYQVDQVGMSDSQVVCFEDMVLKIEKQRPESDNEYEMMKWLEGRLPVPKVLHFERKDGINYLLMSRVEGEMSCTEHLMKNPENLMRIMAEGLKMLWNVDVSDYHQNFRLVDEELEQARYRVEHGLCDMENAEPTTYGEGGFKDPADLLHWLETHKPEEDRVFSHGDFCMPNVMVKDDHVSGFIDIGRCGIADRYRDIALCYRSLDHNYKGYYGGHVYEDVDASMLFEALGMEPDWEKIRYYILLDELF